MNKKLIYCCCVAMIADVLLGGILDAKKDLKLSGDNNSQDGLVLQQALSAENLHIYFPAGVYRLGTIKLPAGTHLSFEQGAKIIPDKKMLLDVPAAQNTRSKKRGPYCPLFLLQGDNISIENLQLDAAFFAENEKTGKRLTSVIVGKGCKNLYFSRFECINTDDDKLPWKRPGGKQLPNVVELESCSDVVLEKSTFENIESVINAYFCTNVSVLNNTARRCSTITTFNAGSSGLRHCGNWSRQVMYQCVFRGGLPSPGRRTAQPNAVHDAIPFGSANVMIREFPANMEWDDVPQFLAERGFGNVILDPQTNIFYLYGVYDIMISNNYAEYGTTLCWGNKGRQVSITNNVARFMWDYSYGTEGCDGVVIANNISINSAVAGVMAMYYTENHQISGNLVIVRHEEPFHSEFAENRPEGTFYGHFLRLHHGTLNKTDTQAGSYYGAGGVNITGNLFVNELATRPSGIAIEAGRDVRFADNKIINGFLLAQAERSYIQKSELQNAAANDEFADAGKISGQNEVTTIIRQGNDFSRLTICNNEFISRQGEKPQILIRSMFSFCAVKDNIIRRETSVLRFSDSQKAKEKDNARLMIYSEQKNPPDATCSTPVTAVWVEPPAGVQTSKAYILSNLIQDYNTPITTAPGVVFQSGNVVGKE